MSNGQTIEEQAINMNNQASMDTGNILKLISKKDTTINNLLSDVVNLKEVQEIIILYGK